MNATLLIEGKSLTEIFSSIGSMLQEELASEMIQILRGQGWIVGAPMNWETPKEVIERLGISANKFWYRMKSPACPKPADTVRSARGIVLIRSTVALDEFLKRELVDQGFRKEAKAAKLIADIERQSALGEIE